MPVGLALNSTAAGVTFAMWPIMWIVFAALILYNTAVLSGRFDAFRRWVLAHLPNDRRIVLIVIGYGFGSLLEGVVDLAFHDGNAWVVVDFKTDREISAEHLDRYRRQVAVYAAAIAKAT